MDKLWSEVVKEYAQNKDVLMVLDSIVDVVIGKRKIVCTDVAFGMEDDNVFLSDMNMRFDGDSSLRILYNAISKTRHLNIKNGEMFVYFDLDNISNVKREHIRNYTYSNSFATDEITFHYKGVVESDVVISIKSVYKA